MENVREVMTCALEPCSHLAVLRNLSHGNMPLGAEVGVSLKYMFSPLAMAEPAQTLRCEWRFSLSGMNR